jgi:futalosine hydrolase
MKHILLIVATKAEIQPLLESFQPLPAHVDVLITGVGMTATAYAIGKQLSQKSYDLFVNIGIAGSFDKTIPLGTVVQITQDCFSELGAEDGDQFLPLSTLGLGDSVYHSPTVIALPEQLHLPTYSAMTVNTVHGAEDSIRRDLAQWPVQIESMEGAAVFYAAQQENIPALQIRAISNYVTKRDRSTWQINKAISELNHWLQQFLSQYRHNEA